MPRWDLKRLSGRWWPGPLALTLGAFLVVWSEVDTLPFGVRTVGYWTGGIGAWLVGRRLPRRTDSFDANRLPPSGPGASKEGD